MCSGKFELLELSGAAGSLAATTGQSQISGFSRYAVPTLFGALKLL